MSDNESNRQDGEPLDATLEPSEDLISLLRATGRFAARMPGREGEGFALDVSLSGVFLAITAPIEEGEEIEVEITLPGDEKVMLQGRVAWVKPNVGGGVEIVSMDDDSRGKLRGFLRQRAIDLKRERLAQAAKKEAEQQAAKNGARDDGAHKDAAVDSDAKQSGQEQGA